MEDTDNACKTAIIAPFCRALNAYNRHKLILSASANGQTTTKQTNGSPYLLRQKYILLHIHVTHAYKGLDAEQNQVRPAANCSISLSAGITIAEYNLIFGTFSCICRKFNYHFNLNSDYHICLLYDLNRGNNHNLIFSATRNLRVLYKQPVILRTDT